MHDGTLEKETPVKYYWHGDSNWYGSHDINTSFPGSGQM